MLRVVDMDVSADALARRLDGQKRLADAWERFLANAIDVSRLPFLGIAEAHEAVIMLEREEWLSTGKLHLVGRPWTPPDAPMLRPPPSMTADQILSARRRAFALFRREDHGAREKKQRSVTHLAQRERAEARRMLSIIGATLDPFDQRYKSDTARRR